MVADALSRLESEVNHLTDSVPTHSDSVTDTASEGCFLDETVHSGEIKVELSENLIFFWKHGKNNFRAKKIVYHRNIGFKIATKFRAARLQFQIFRKINIFPENQENHFRVLGG